ncbi:hypothetical protein K437DRAFT_123829 [Tilletiaria anomala UBC 951]|uniref:Uncharacterized protein n=1 Tax=Tilletiaria anomala (strain ATCC 24038 / CBS 436.72 / UBC 951) TaxID=1037660 RepID=A0A066W357_TILAU|nr:uncharacterized protein K437DRAFT_123829 [Tilletiaria anomala UBC 951]KDN45220.1 hypothetical protein K437DRAFT_123829 [Tilletiaria anomala UBC 951]
MPSIAARISARMSNLYAEINLRVSRQRMGSLSRMGWLKRRASNLHPPLSDCLWPCALSACLTASSCAAANFSVLSVTRAL